MKDIKCSIRSGLRRNRRTFSFIISFVLSLSLLCACGDSKDTANKGSGSAPTQADAQKEQAKDNAGSSDSDAQDSGDVEVVDAADEEIAESTGESTTGASEGSVAEDGEEAEATPTPKPGKEEKPTPTPKAAHVHSYTVTSSVAGQDCRHSGVDTYTCSCGDSYTQDNGKYGDHVWVTDTAYTTEVIHHDAEYKTDTVWICDCGITWTSYDDVSNHYASSSCGGFHSSTKKTVIREAYDEEIQTPYTRTYCAVCGTE